MLELCNLIHITKTEIMEEEEQITGISGDPPPGTSGGDESSRGSHRVSGHSGASGVIEDYEMKNNTRQK